MQNHDGLLFEKEHCGRQLVLLTKEGLPQEDEMLQVGSYCCGKSSLLQPWKNQAHLCNRTVHILRLSPLFTTDDLSVESSTPSLRLGESSNFIYSHRLQP